MVGEENRLVVEDAEEELCDGIEAFLLVIELVESIGSLLSRKCDCGGEKRQLMSQNATLTKIYHHESSYENAHRSPLKEEERKGKTSSA